jgi:hypothetical protein
MLPVRLLVGQQLLLLMMRLLLLLLMRRLLPLMLLGSWQQLQQQHHMPAHLPAGQRLPACRLSCCRPCRPLAGLSQ